LQPKKRVIALLVGIMIILNIAVVFASIYSKDTSNSNINISENQQQVENTTIKNIDFEIPYLFCEETYYQPLCVVNSTDMYFYGARPTHYEGDYEKRNYWIHYKRYWDYSGYLRPSHTSIELEIKNGDEGGRHDDIDFSIVSGQDHSSRFEIYSDNEIPYGYDEKGLKI
jgi:hypothetical protein